MKEKKVYCAVEMHELAQLLKDSYELKRLEMAGVDNWIGYDIAMDGSDFDEEPVSEYTNLSDEELTKEYRKTEEL